MPRPRLSMCMIARDSARTLCAALDSIRPWVDEMVVVDTGSVDATPAMAAACGARVAHFAWCDDFAAARNQSLRLATGEWLFWMDSDDTIDAADGQALRALADAAHGARGGGGGRLPRGPGAAGGAASVERRCRDVRRKGVAQPRGAVRGHWAAGCGSTGLAGGGGA